MNEYEIKINNLKRLNDSQFNTLFENSVSKYRNSILKYIMYITGKNEEDITENEVSNGMINIIYISGSSVNKDDIFSNFINLSVEDVNKKIVENIYIRDKLNEKIGIKKDYDCSGEVGDNGICDSVDFSLEDVAHIFNKNISNVEFKQISDEYLTSILEVVKRNANLKVYATYESSDLKFDEEKIIQDYSNFLSGNDILNMKNKIVFKEMINLIATYPIDVLLNDKQSIKKEIATGVYDFIKEPEPKFDSNERERLNNITNVWNREDMANYKNLSLLKKRFSDLLENVSFENSETINATILDIDEVLGSGIPEVNGETQKHTPEDVKTKMLNWYSNFEKLNKENLINSVYNSNKNVDMDNFLEMPESMLVHFYAPNSGMSDFFKLVAINRMRISNNEEPIVCERFIDMYKNEELIVKINEDSQRFKTYLDSFELKNCEEELLPNKTFIFEKGDTGIPRVNVLKAASKQLACYLINKESIIGLLENDKRMTSGNGNIAFAVGFSKDSISEKNILLTSDMNANSNIGKDNIPCEDSFVSLSKTYKELEEVNNKRTEVLLNRDDISANYFLCIEGENITEEEEEMKEAEIKKAEELGLNVIKVDIEKIRANMKEEKIKKDNKDICI